MRQLLALLAIVLTIGAGIPSAPAEMMEHCDQHQVDGGHHGSAPGHQHHSDTHCPTHSCASASPCSSLSVLLRTEPASQSGASISATRDSVAHSRYASRDIRPTPPPPRVLSA